jgi:hypothetical protein
VTESGAALHGVLLINQRNQQTLVFGLFEAKAFTGAINMQLREFFICHLDSAKPLAEIET